MGGAVTVITYATPATMKDYTKIADSIDDAAIDRVLNAASRRVDTYCQRRFWVDDGQTGTRIYKPVNCGLMWIDDLSTSTGFTVETDDNDDGTYETTWSSADYELRPPSAPSLFPEARPYTQIAAVESRRFPTATKRHSLRLTGKWGWPAVPDTVTEATLMLALRLMVRPGAPFAIATAGIGDVTPMRLTSGGANSTGDPDADKLLLPYRYPTAAVLVA
jgi:hypothetical protein